MTKFSNLVKASVFSTIAIVSIAASSQASATTQDTDQAPQAEMSIKGADFTSPAVIKKLQAKARMVAHNMCISGDSPLPTTSERDCYNIAIKSAFGQIEAKHQLALADSTTNLAAGETIRSSVRTER